MATQLKRDIFVLNQPRVISRKGHADRVVKEFDSTHYFPSDPLEATSTGVLYVDLAWTEAMEGYGLRQRLRDAISPPAVLVHNGRYDRLAHYEAAEANMTAAVSLV